MAKKSKWLPLGMTLGFLSFASLGVFGWMQYGQDSPDDLLVKNTVEAQDNSKELPKVTDDPFANSMTEGLENPQSMIPPGLMPGGTNSENPGGNNSLSRQEMMERFFPGRNSNNSSPNTSPSQPDSMSGNLSTTRPTRPSRPSNDMVPAFDPEKMSEIFNLPAPPRQGEETNNTENPNNNGNNQENPTPPQPKNVLICKGIVSVNEPIAYLVYDGGTTRTCKVGAIIGEGYKVVKIDENEVTLKKNDKSVIIAVGKDGVLP